MKTVFTNGCFDIVHRGHIELLEFCYSIGNNVIVGLNSDKSIKLLKGDTRPINTQEDRKKFDEETPEKLIKSLMPDIIVKGGDYRKEHVVGNDACEVRIFKYVEGYSTTKTIQDISDR